MNNLNSQTAQLTTSATPQDKINFDLPSISTDIAPEYLQSIWNLYILGLDENEITDIIKNRYDIDIGPGSKFYDSSMFFHPVHQLICDMEELAKKSNILPSLSREFKPILESIDSFSDSKLTDIIKDKKFITGGNNKYKTTITLDEFKSHVVEKVEQRKRERHKQKIRNGIIEFDEKYQSKAKVVRDIYSPPVTASDIINSDAEIQYLIDDFMIRGEATLIHGQGGAGKSMLTYNLALSLSNDTCATFLGKEISYHCPVLIVQSENSIGSTKSRLNAIVQQNEAFTSRDNIFFTNMDGICTGPKLMPDNGVDNDLIETIRFELRRIYAHTGKEVGLIIIDPFISYLGCSENSADEIRPRVDRLTKFCKEHGNITPLLIDHQGKSTDDVSRGSSAKRDYARIEYGLSRASKAMTNKYIEATRSFSPDFEISNGSEGDLSLLKLTLLKENDLKVRAGTHIFYQNNNLSFKVIDEDHINNIKRITKDNDEKSIVDFIKDCSEGCAHADLVNEVIKVKGCSAVTARRFIKKLVDDGNIKKEGATKNLKYFPGDNSK